jgi:hypothetical protein
MPLDGTYQLPAYADDMNLLGDNIDTMKKNKQTISYANWEINLEINIENTKYICMLLVHHHSSGQNCDIQIGNRSLKICHRSNIWER